MQTYRLWLEPDPDIPAFSVLHHELVDVEIKDIIEGGIHPHGEKEADRSLADMFAQLLNQDEMKFKSLAESDYCGDVDASIRQSHYSQVDKFDDLLMRNRKQIRFVENLTYQQLLDLAKEQLRLRWCHALAKQLAQRIYYGFNELRSFIKSKDKKVKLRSYDDLDSHDLGEVLRLGDFETEDRILISEGLPVTNFRKAEFLRRVTDQSGRLQLVDCIDSFQLRPTNQYSGYNRTMLTYNGRRSGASILLFPSMSSDLAIREKARRLAEIWRLDKGRYCFTTDITRLTQMHESAEFKIGFPSLDYQHHREPPVSTAGIKRIDTERFCIGKYLTARHSGDALKAVLRDHGVSMTGNKDRLLRKLADLALALYRKHEPELKSFFQGQRFIRIQSSWGHNGREFPLLYDHDLRNMLLTMFVIRHLRGNVILDAGYENDTFDLNALAHSLLTESVNLSGSFIRVAN